MALFCLCFYLSHPTRLHLRQQIDSRKTPENNQNKEKAAPSSGRTAGLSACICHPGVVVHMCEMKEMNTIISEAFSGSKISFHPHPPPHKTMRYQAVVSSKYPSLHTLVETAGGISPVNNFHCWLSLLHTFSQAREASIHEGLKGDP